MTLLPYLSFLAIAVAGAPWLVALSRRFGVPLALGAVIAGMLLLVMASLFVSSALGFHPLAAVMATTALAAVLGVLAVRRTPGSLRRPSASTLVRWIPAAVGAVAWIGVVSLAQVIPGAAPLSWAMNGDGGNNIHDARYFLEVNGIDTRFSVPLSGSLLMLGMAPGRTATAAAELLHHDLVALSVVWTLELAATALLLGLVASSLVPNRRLAIAAIASAGGSLLATTWCVAGLPIEYGYLNVHLVLPFVLASWLVFLHSARFAVAAIAIELGLGVLLLTTWTPLIVFTLVFVIAIMLRNRASLRVLRGRPLVVVAVAAAVFIVPFVFSAVPALAIGGSTLLLPGHGLPFTGWLLAALLVFVLVSAVVLRAKTHLPVLEGAIATSAAAILGIGVLLFIVRQLSDPWSSYYPAKLTWLLFAAVIPIAVALAIRGIVEFVKVPRVATVTAAALAALAVVLASLGPAPSRESFTIVQPLQKIIAGEVWSTGDHAVEKILRYSGGDGTDLLWLSDDPDEARINFWILQFNGGDPSGDTVVREFALRGYRTLRDLGSYQAGEAPELCELAAKLEQPVRIHTAHSQLSAELTAACPELKVTVLVGS